MMKLRVQNGHNTLKWSWKLMNRYIRFLSPQVIHLQAPHRFSIHNYALSFYMGFGAPEIRQLVLDSFFQLKMRSTFSSHYNNNSPIQELLPWTQNQPRRYSKFWSWLHESFSYIQLFISVISIVKFTTLIPFLIASVYACLCYLQSF